GRSRVGRWRRPRGAPRRHLAPLAAAQLPLSLAVDLHREDLVLLRIQRLEHRPCRRHRDLVLARAPSHEDGDPDATVARAHGEIVVVVSVVVGVVGSVVLRRLCPPPPLLTLQPPPPPFPPP